MVARDSELREPTSMICGRADQYVRWWCRFFVTSVINTDKLLHLPYHVAMSEALKTSGPLVVIFCYKKLMPGPFRL